MKKSGFVLVEMVTTLIIVLMLITISPIINQNICEIKINHFIKTLSQDMNYSLHYSMTNFTMVKFQFEPNNHTYKIYDTDLKHIKSYQYDKKLLINSYITYNIIEITHGHVREYGYFILTCGSLKYRVNIYEKSGIINATKQ